MCIRDIARTKRDDLFSPTPTIYAMRILFLLAMIEHKEIRIGDFSSAFLNATLDEPVFVIPPKILGRQGKLWKVKKAWYGLRQAPQAFSRFLAGIFESLGFQRSKSCPMIFHHPQGIDTACHVDDPVTVGSVDGNAWFFNELQQRLKFKPGPAFGLTPVKYLGKTLPKASQQRD